MFDTKSYEEKLKVATERLGNELKKIRTGRAHPAQLDGIKVEVYGTLMPINQVANITALDAQMLLITPFDANNIRAISEAIRADQSLSLNPSDDGRVIRVPIPPLTEDRRKQLVKQASEKVEETKISFRVIRQEALKEIKRQKDAKTMSEDDARRAEKSVDDIISDASTKIETLFKEKEKDILTI